MRVKVLIPEMELGTNGEAYWEGASFLKPRNFYNLDIKNGLYHLVNRFTDKIISADLHAYSILVKQREF